MCTIKYKQALLTFLASLHTDFPLRQATCMTTGSPVILLLLIFLLLLFISFLLSLLYLLLFSILQSLFLFLLLFLYCYSCAYCYFYCLLSLALSLLTISMLGWMPQGCCHLRLDHPGLSKSGTAPKGISHSEH
jgi:hypothetical protein